MLTAAVVVAIAGYAAWLVWELDWPAETVFLPLFAAIISLLYVGAFVGILFWATGAVVLAGVALAVRVAWRSLDGSLARPRLNVGVISFLAAVVLVGWRLRHAAFLGWDEFSHWGLASREIILNHALPGRVSPVLLRDYPPAASLFHYFVAVGDLSEPTLYRAHALLALSALAALCGRGRRWLAPVTVVFGYFGLYAFCRGFQTLDVDHLVALFFGCGLGAYFVWDDDSRILRLIPVVFVLPLLKAVGLLLAILLVGIVGCDRWFAHDRRSGTRVSLALLVLAPILASASWSAHVRHLAAPTSFPIRPSASAVIDALSPEPLSPRARATRAAFSDALRTLPVGPDRLEEPARAGPSALPSWTLTTREWLAAFVIAAGVLAAALGAGQRRRFAVCLGGLAVCVVAHLGGLLFLYLFSFSEYEGVRLASFGRYVGLLMFGLALVTFAWMAKALDTPGSRVPLVYACLAATTVGMLVTAPAEAFRFGRDGALPLQPIRRQAQELLAPLLPYIALDGHVYVVVTGTGGYEALLARYELSPRLINADCWSLGPPRFQGDVWSCALTAAEWAQRLQDYDYVVLGITDDRFWQDYGELFNGRRDVRLYERVQGRFRPVAD